MRVSTIMVGGLYHAVEKIETAKSEQIKPVPTVSNITPPTPRSPTHHDSPVCPPSPEEATARESDKGLHLIIPTQPLQYTRYPPSPTYTNTPITYYANCIIVINVIGITDVVSNVSIASN